MDVGFNGGTEKEEREGGRMYPLPYSYFFNGRGQQKEKVVVQEREDRKGKRGEGKRERNVPPSIPLIYSSFFFF